MWAGDSDKEEPDEIPSTKQMLEDIKFYAEGFSRDGFNVFVQHGA